MKASVWLSLLCASSAAVSQTLNLPPRAPHAPTGSKLVERLTPLSPDAREQELFAQVASGNVPDFLRQLRPVTVTNVEGGRTNTATLHVTPDYLAVGSDADHFLTPLTPATAQRIADLAQCNLPTRKLVNVIHAAAEVKLSPSPLSPGPQMTTVTDFAKHNSIVRTQRAAFLESSPLGALVAGHKKDVVITARLAQSPGKVAIYGWHHTNGAPIQPLYLGHTAAWVDYSHGVRLVQRSLQVNGKPRSVAAVLADANLAGLLSDEGTFVCSRYATNAVQSPLLKTNPPVPASTESAGLFPAGFVASPQFNELVREQAFAPEVKIRIVAPARGAFAPGKPVLLVFFGLPNGNTTDQTIGRKLKAGDDWHFDIQHIGAQTRFLRQVIKDQTLVVAYLEAESKSWPAWRRKHGDQPIPRIVAHVNQMFAAWPVEVVLSGHSGGGSFIFGYLNTFGEIPGDVARIAFLDANYAYDRTTGHGDKLLRWLRASTNHHLCVLAYQDYVALLDGKPFVSENGGTWGRSQAMLRDLGDTIPFCATTNGPLATHIALDGRVQFWLRENPERKIYHTVQVERNGFIHALLAGTPFEQTGYVYLGERAYGALISAE